MDATVAVRAARAADTRWDVAAAALFTVAVLVHNFDHVRRGGDSVTTDVFVAGTLAIPLEVLIVLLLCQRHRLAPIVCAGGGFSLAAGYVLVHFLPGRGWLSDSFSTGDDVSPLSWFAASLEVVAALAVGSLGTARIRERGGLAGSLARPEAQRTRAEAVRHPLVLAMIVGNALVLILSFVDR